MEIAGQWFCQGCPASHRKSSLNRKEKVRRSLRSSPLVSHRARLEAVDF